VEQLAPKTASPTFEAKVQAVFALVAQGEEAVATALRKGRLRIKLSRQPRTTATRTPGAPVIGRKMDEEKVREFRQRRLNGESVAQLAEAYGISVILAQNIDKKRRWASVA
jgi:DNA invertase Pin-like site-specific DNA recombinase